MESQNVAIIILFVLFLVLLFQLYFKRKTGRPSVTEYPENLQDIQNVITDNPGQTIRASGDNYTFNDISLTDDVILHTNKLNNIISLDKDRRQICVESGCTIKDVCIYLEQEGLALDSIPENIDQTIGSVCSTAEHGSNLDCGTMSDQIVDITVVLSNGHIRRIEFDDPEFPAYATGLGSLGIVYSITLRCVDYYFIHIETKTGMWTDIKKDLLELLKVYKQSQLAIDPKTLQATITLCTKTTDPTGYVYYKTKQQNTHTKSDVAIPYTNTINAIDDVLKLQQNYKQSGLDYIAVSFTGPDYNAWLSPAAGRETTWIQIYTIPLTNNRYLQDFEDLLLYKYSGRPNWTTSKVMDAYKVRLLYGISIDYVRRVRDRFDPKHCFTNEYISAILD